ncbi:glycosyltransferase family 2 protein [Bacteroidia bacterium]|nr:glycosyltransferase family 2 protein [Bacteroidia bacterium]MDB9882959.1 glycosyltransferase family 2 protein [Bacteroidia bacterium]
MKKKELSVVVPVMNEEENVELLLTQITEALVGIDHEVIFVDDGSTDETLTTLIKNSSETVKVVEFMKNFGQSSAMQAGIDFAEGEYIATLDGDLQNDPSDIPSMLSLLKEKKVDLVAGERLNRKDGALLRKIPSNIANAIIRRTTGVYIKDYGCTLKVFTSKTAKMLNIYGELHRFIPVLAALQGSRIIQVPVKHHPRIHGTSKYGINRTIKVVSDLFLMVFLRKYMIKPMHFFGGIGMGVFGLGMLINLYFLVKKIMGEDIWGRPMLLLGILLLLGGIQLITVGILSELQMRTYYESQNKKIYNVREVHGG